MQADIPTNATFELPKLTPHVAEVSTCDGSPSKDSPSDDDYPADVTFKSPESDPFRHREFLFPSGNASLDTRLVRTPPGLRSQRADTALAKMGMKPVRHHTVMCAPCGSLNENGPPEPPTLGTVLPEIGQMLLSFCADGTGQAPAGNAVAEITPSLFNEIPRDIDGNLLSVGSINHAHGHCKPCLFFHRQGCSNGVRCTFCHHTHTPKKKTRSSKRKRLAGQKEAGASQPSSLSMHSGPSAFDSKPFPPPMAPDHQDRPDQLNSWQELWSAPRRTALGSMHPPHPRYTASDAPSYLEISRTMYLGDGLVPADGEDSLGPWNYDIPGQALPKLAVTKAATAWPSQSPRTMTGNMPIVSRNSRRARTQDPRPDLLQYLHSSWNSLYDRAGSACHSATNTDTSDVLDYMHRGLSIWDPKPRRLSNVSTDTSTDHNSSPENRPGLTLYPSDVDASTGTPHLLPEPGNFSLTTREIPPFCLDGKDDPWLRPPDTTKPAELRMPWRRHTASAVMDNCDPSAMLPSHLVQSGSFHGIITGEKDRILEQMTLPSHSESANSQSRFEDTKPLFSAHHANTWLGSTPANQWSLPTATDDLPSVCRERVQLKTASQSDLLFHAFGSLNETELG